MPDTAAMIISPHLDDAVFSCGELLANEPGTIVATLFAGAPRTGPEVTEWDRAAGFRDGEDVIAARRREDHASLASLSCTPLWLEFCDDQYGMPTDMAAVKQALEELLAAWRPARLFLPLGLFHADHLRAHHAGFAAWRRAPQPILFAYEEAHYRRIPGLVQRRLAELHATRVEATPALLDGTRHTERKKRALDHYASQLRALSVRSERGVRDLLLPERYWSLRALPQAAGGSGR